MKIIIMFFLFAVMSSPEIAAHSAARASRASRAPVPRDAGKYLLFLERTEENLKEFGNDYVEAVNAFGNAIWSKDESKELVEEGKKLMVVLGEAKLLKLEKLKDIVPLIETAYPNAIKKDDSISIPLKNGNALLVRTIPHKQSGIEIRLQDKQNQDRTFELKGKQFFSEKQWESLKEAEREKIEKTWTVTPALQFGPDSKHKLLFSPAIEHIDKKAGKRDWVSSANPAYLLDQIGGNYLIDENQRPFAKWHKVPEMELAWQRK